MPLRPPPPPPLPLSATNSGNGVPAINSSVTVDYNTGAVRANEECGEARCCRSCGRPVSLLSPGMLLPTEVVV
jgi:hypothetical protein